jgi:hypothetical protein
MNIRLFGALPRELKELGLKPGMKFQNVDPAPGFPEGSMIIRWMDEGTEMRAVVSSYNYVKYKSFSYSPGRIRGVLRKAGVVIARDSKSASK